MAADLHPSAILSSSSEVTETFTHKQRKYLVYKYFHSYPFLQTFMDSLHSFTSFGYGYLALLLASVLTLLYLYKQQRIKIPGPWGFPIIGSLHLLGSLPHDSLRNLSIKYGEIFQLRLGSVSFVVFSSASMAKEIFGTYSVEFASKIPTVAGKVLGNDFSGIVYSMYTPQYNLLKKVLKTHLLSTSRLRLYEGARRKEQFLLLKSLFNLSDTPVLVREQLHTLNMNTITLMLFGERYSGSTMAESVKLDEFVSVITDAVRVSGFFNISDYIPFLRPLDLQGIEKQIKQIMSTVNKCLSDIINDHRAQIQAKDDHQQEHEHSEPRCFVDTLLLLKGSEKLSDVCMITLIFDVLLGAVDTSALSAEWALTELIRHPSKLMRAQKEIEQVVGNERVIEESDLAKLPYLDAIAKETSRLHPLVPIVLNRKVTSSCTIKGYHIPAGTAAIINLGAILLDGKHWEKPLEFLPERFMEEDVDIFGMSYDLIPFGVGRRMCPGLKIGFDTLRMALGIMIQGFNWSVECSKIDMRETYGLVCHKTVPLIAVPSPRLPTHVYSSEN